MKTECLKLTKTLRHQKKSKKGWAPDKNHHTVDTVVEALKKISKVLNLSNLNDHIQTSIKVKMRQLKIYSKGKISSFLTMIKEEPLSL